MGVSGKVVGLVVPDIETVDVSVFSGIVDFVGSVLGVVTGVAGEGVGLGFGELITGILGMVDFVGLTALGVVTGVVSGVTGEDVGLGLGEVITGISGVVPIVTGVVAVVFGVV